MPVQIVLNRRNPGRTVSYLERMRPTFTLQNGLCLVLWVSVNRKQRRFVKIWLVGWLVLWAQSTTKDYIKAEHKLHSISKLFISHVIISQVMFFGFFLAYLYSTGTQHGNLPPAVWPMLFCGPTQEPCVSHSQHSKNRKRFWKKNTGE